MWPDLIKPTIGHICHRSFPLDYNRISTTTIPQPWVLRVLFCHTKLKGRIYKTRISRMEGRIYISVVIGDAWGHRRICSPDRRFVDMPYQLCTAVLSECPMVGFVRSGHKWQWMRFLKNYKKIRNGRTELKFFHFKIQPSSICVKNFSSVHPFLVFLCKKSGMDVRGGNFFHV